jgi:SOUL heme-binding protein
MRFSLLLGLPLIAAACATERVEEPLFSLKLSDGNFAVREYAPTIVAETTVQGDAFGSRFEGFGPLADYIFAKDRAGDKIAMTAPVTQAPREKIAMTAPVTQQANSGDTWTIAFTMPAGSTLQSLPAPASPEVKLIEQPSRTMAVYSFTGIADDNDMSAARNVLMQKVASAGLKPSGEPVFAFYDPPWTLAFMRRNEVMVEVASNK